MDSQCWRRLCTSFGQHSNDLCLAMATFAKKIATIYVDPSHLSTYTACRLILLDKQPGVRPIGIADVCRRIIGKVIMKYAKTELQQAVGPLQLCAGFVSGCEAGFHAMKAIFDKDECEGMIFVDASNAFNQLNREATIINCQSICPALAPVLINTYRLPPSLYVDGECIKSFEGTTQGDPLGLAMYAIGTSPLIKSLCGLAEQVWYADDSSAGSTLTNLKRWWDALSQYGPKYGYFPNSSKTKLLVKPQYVEEAHTIFQGTGIEVCHDGGKYLGGAIGTSSFIESFLQQKVATWLIDLERLIDISRTQPQAAYSAFTHGFMSRWNYLFRIIDVQFLASDVCLNPIEHQLRTNFFTALTGQEPPNNTPQDLIALPVNLGGLNLPNPTLYCSDQFDASQKITAPLVKQVLDQDNSQQQQSIDKVKAAVKAEKTTKLRDRASTIMRQLPSPLQRNVQLAQEKGAPSWLSAILISAHGFSLTKAEFRDAIALRYGWPLQQMPSHCSCGHTMSVDHALSCPVGGYPSFGTMKCETSQPHCFRMFATMSTSNLPFSL